MLVWPRRKRLGGHRLTGKRITHGNRVDLLVDGAAAFPAMLDAIARAQSSIDLEMYAFASDGTGKRFLDALVAACRRGLRVRVIVDGVGSISTPDEFFAPLVEAGGDTTYTGP